MPIVITQNGGQSYKIIPAPILSFQKTFKRLGDGRKAKPLFNLSLIGTIINDKGSPYIVNAGDNSILFDNSGTFHYPNDTIGGDVFFGQDELRLKIEGLRSIMTDGSLLEVTPWTASGTPMKCYFRMNNFSVEEGLWYRTAKYKIDLETDTMLAGSPDIAPTEDAFPDSGNLDKYDGYDIVANYNIEDCSENYNIEIDSEIYGIFKCTHTISAKGYRTWDTVGQVANEAWENAKTFVDDRLGYNPLYFQSGCFGNVSGQFSNYNHYRTNSIDKFGGSYSVTENWILASGNYTEDFSAELRQSITDPFQTVSINGSINGLTNFQVGTDTWTASSGLIKYQNASGIWNSTISGSLYTRAQQYIGVQLNPFPVTQTVTHNFLKGIINYACEFNNRATPLISGARSETLSINDENVSGWVDVIAEHVILNRAIGGIIQPINTTANPTRAISYEAVFAAPTYGGSGNDLAYLMSLKPRFQVDTMLSGLIPPNYAPGYLFITQDTESWQPLSQRYSRNVTYRWEREV